MPCYDHRSSVEYQEEECARKTAELRERNNVLMRCICTMERVLNLTPEQLDLCGKEVKDVIIEHRKQDAILAARQARERQRLAEKKREAAERKAAIASLTPAQKRALGIK
jgi:hypothetical protein